MMIPRGIFLLALCAALQGCAVFRHGKKNDPAKISAPAPRRVGTVAVVNGGFVLVDVGTLYSPAPGTALKCLASGQETAVLAVSPERRPPFITADIIRGAPRAGDEVFE